MFVISKKKDFPCSQNCFQPKFFQLEEYYEPIVRDDDFVCMVVDGSCYYDVEPEVIKWFNYPQLTIELLQLAKLITLIKEDEWIRCHLEKGDLVIIPKGLSHRFTITPKVR